MTIQDDPKTFHDIRHLPYWSALKQTRPSDLAVFALLTWKYEPQSEVQMREQVESFIASIGEQGFVPLQRMLWVYRIEGGKYWHEYADNHSICVRKHVHLVLWKERIVTDAEQPRTKQEAVTFLQSQWKHGIPFVRKYDSRSRKALAYTLKAREGVQSADYVDFSAMSNELFKRLRKAAREVISKNIYRIAA